MSDADRHTLFAKLECRVPVTQAARELTLGIVLFEKMIDQLPSVRGRDKGVVRGLLNCDRQNSPLSTRADVEFASSFDLDENGLGHV